MTSNEYQIQKENQIALANKALQTVKINNFSQETKKQIVPVVEYLIAAIKGNITEVDKFFNETQEHTAEYNHEDEINVSKGIKVKDKETIAGVQISLTNEIAQAISVSQKSMFTSITGDGFRTFLKSKDFKLNENVIISMLEDVASVLMLSDTNEEIIQEKEGIIEKIVKAVKGK